MHTPAVRMAKVRAGCLSGCPIGYTLFLPDHPFGVNPMRTLCLLIVGVIVGWAAAGVDWTPDAIGHDALNPTVGGAPPADPPGAFVVESLRPSTPHNAISRYRISAFALESQSIFGAYIVDTVTGTTWHVLRNNAPVLIGDLPQPAAKTMKASDLQPRETTVEPGDAPSEPGF
jgi:hypothetical protein